MKNFKVLFVECVKFVEEEVREWNFGKLESFIGEDFFYVERGLVVDFNEIGIFFFQGVFIIIDVCVDKVLFDIFIKEWSCQLFFVILLVCINKFRDFVIIIGGIGVKFIEVGDIGYKFFKGM